MPFFYLLKGDTVIEREVPPPEATLVPGVCWGLSRRSEARLKETQLTVLGSVLPSDASIGWRGMIQKSLLVKEEQACSQSEAEVDDTGEVSEAVLGCHQ
jgi:hypothetical protein